MCLSMLCIVVPLLTSGYTPTSTHLTAFLTITLLNSLSDIEAASQPHVLRHAILAVALMLRTNLSIPISAALYWHRRNTNRAVTAMHSAFHFNNNIAMHEEASTA